jgi:hypothetical protein
LAHWYHQNGDTFYTIGKSDKTGDRDVTLRDARKVGAVPSVTTIIGQLGKPQLEKWKLLKLLEYIERQESIQKITSAGDKWKEIVLAKLNEELSCYSKRGTEVHDALEQYYKECTLPKQSDLPFILPAIQLLDKLFQTHGLIKIVAEPSFCHRDGFGGKIDLLVYTEEGLIILDYKTKQGKDLGSKSIYPDYKMQLAAYAEAYKQEDLLYCANMLISVTDPGEHYLHIWSEKDLEDGRQMFYNLLEYWKLSNNYRPEEFRSQ